ncbi:hypothetical protein [Aminipila sp.]|uniref:hypothetical protein n=1 Tax=Aminipila sp. TaxID=2060095 RepID=UPI00289CA498|nr:hypothetical protein [Aminipila sp.]
MSRKVVKNMSARVYQTNVEAMTREGITRTVEDCERTGSCEGDPGNNIEWYKTKGWVVVGDGHED